MSSFRMYHEIVNHTNRFSRKYQTNCDNFEIHIQYQRQEENVDLKDIFNEMNRVLDEILVTTLVDIEDEHQIRVSLLNVDLERDIYTNFRKKKDFTSDVLLNEIIKVSQSKKEFLLKCMIELDVVSVNVPSIGGRSINSHSFVNVDKWRKNSNKVIPVKGDGLCVARAIVVSKAHADGLRGNE